MMKNILSYQIIKKLPEVLKGTLRKSSKEINIYIYIMTKKQNLTFLKSYLHIAKPAVVAQVQKIIDNFQDRHIRNFETAKNVLDKLTSSNKNTARSGLMAYDKVMLKYENAVPVGKPVKLQVLGRPTKAKVALKNSSASKIGKNWRNSIILSTEVVSTAFKKNIMQVNVKETKFNKSVYQRVAIEAVIYKAYQAAIKKLPMGSNFKFHAVLHVSGVQDGNFTVRSHTFNKSDFLGWFNQIIEKNPSTFPVIQKFGTHDL